MKTGRRNRLTTIPQSFTKAGLRTVCILHLKASQLVEERTGLFLARRLVIMQISPYWQFQSGQTCGFS